MTDIRPSIVIYLNPDGSLAAESYRNGSRVKLPLFDGFALETIKQELAAQQRELATRAEEAERRRAAEVEARHRRVFATMAARQGLGFAKAKLGSVPDSLKRAVAKADKAQQGSISLDEALSL